MSDKPAFVKCVTFSDTCSTLPPVEAWRAQGSDPDLFICALGFEDRAPTIAVQLASDVRLQASASTRHALRCVYSTNHEDNQRNADTLDTSLARFCSVITEVSADSPHDIRNEVLDAVRERAIGRRCRVAFDISAASGSLILSVMRALADVSTSVELDILYTEPEEYFPSKTEFDCRLQELVAQAIEPGTISSVAEHGVSEVEDNELFPGVDGDSRPTFIIAIPAFRTARLSRCLTHVSDQPLASPETTIFWIIGEPPASQLKWRRELQERIVNFQLASFVGLAPSDTLAPRLTDKNHAMCSTRDYREILRTIVEQVDGHAGFNISLVHMGSKLQGVGAALALAARTEVAVCSSRPVQFNPKLYSHGVGAQWHLSLGKLDEIIERIVKIGTLRLETKIETSRERRNSL